MVHSRFQEAMISSVQVPAPKSWQDKAKSAVEQFYGLWKDIAKSIEARRRRDLVTLARSGMKNLIRN